ncbi:hypothetical protein HBB16_07975 [Pseudonocardia sp. MCCB 268]|nr:hypothetical protein [Pseudonocardia cytotoxica]
MNGCVDRMRAADAGAATRPAGPTVTADPAGRLVTRLAVGDALARLPAEQRVAVGKAGGRSRLPGHGGGRDRRGAGRDGEEPLRLRAVAAGLSSVRSGSEAR